MAHEVRQWQWNARHLFLVMFLVAVALVVLRRPLNALFDGALGTVTVGLPGQYFFAPFIHLAWLSGADVHYPPRPLQDQVDECVACFGAGLTVSVLLHGALLIGAWHMVCLGFRWCASQQRKEDRWHITPWL